MGGLGRRMDIQTTLILILKVWVFNEITFYFENAFEILQILL
jgi:hypothetical protein